MYLLFQTLEDAQSAQSVIDGNIRAATTDYNPAAIDEAGLIGRNAATGELDPSAPRTTTWCEPIECIEGWALVKPEGLAPDVFDGVDLLAGVPFFVQSVDVSLVTGAQGVSG